MDKCEARPHPGVKSAGFPAPMAVMDEALEYAKEHPDAWLIFEGLFHLVLKHLDDEAVAIAGRTALMADLRGRVTELRAGEGQR